MHNNDIGKWEIGPEEVEDLIAKNEQIQLVDVREEWELVRGVIPDSAHVPLSKFGEHLDFWKPGHRYVVYCEHGIRSMDVVAWLAENKQIEAKSLQGGFSVWQGPVVDTSGKRKS